MSRSRESAARSKLSRWLGPRRDDQEQGCSWRGRAAGFPALSRSSLLRPADPRAFFSERYQAMLSPLESPPWEKQREIAMRVHRTTAALIAGAMLPFCAAGLAADPPGWSKNWPQFRGPSGNGTTAAEVDPPARFNLPKDLRYSKSVPKKGSSSPIIWGKRIYLTGEGACIMAFDRETGRLEWNTALKVPAAAGEPDDDASQPAPMGKTAGGAASTPVTDGKFVYAFFANGVLGCVDSGGKQVWVRRLVSGKPKNIYGFAASPILHGDLLIQVIDQGMNARAKESFVVAVRTKDGAEAWRKDSPGQLGLVDADSGSRTGQRRDGYDRPSPGDCLRPADRPAALAGEGHVRRGTLGLAGAVRQRHRGTRRHGRIDRLQGRRHGGRDQVRPGLDIGCLTAERGQPGCPRWTLLPPGRRHDDLRRRRHRQGEVEPGVSRGSSGPRPSLPRTGSMRSIATV